MNLEKLFNNRGEHLLGVKPVLYVVFCFFVVFLSGLLLHYTELILENYLFG